MLIIDNARQQRIDIAFAIRLIGAAIFTRQQQQRIGEVGHLTQLVYDETGYRRLQTRYYPSPTVPGTVNANDYNSYTYDGNGNVLTERKRNNAIVTNTYDANNRLTFKDLSDNTYQSDVSYNYDARGLML